MNTKNNLFVYIYKKLVGAGFSFSLFMLIYIMIARFNLFELSQTLKEPLLWFAFYGYGILSSIVIDAIIKWLPKCKRYAFFKYVLFGFIPFMLFDSHLVYVLIAGVIGTFAAILFFIGLTYITKNKWVALIFSIALPLILLFVSTYDFTKKINWQAERSDTSFQASFSYFNGEHKIPIDLKKGEKLTYIVTVDTKNSGGWGNHFENKRGDYLPMAVDGEYLEYVVEKDEIYYIVVSGNKIRGTFNVEWEIVKDE